MSTMLSICVYITVSCVFARLGLNEVGMFVLMLLLLLDTFTGIIKAKRIGDDITSSKWIGGMAAKFILLLIPIIISLGFKSMEWDGNSIMNAYVGLVSLATSYSALSNCYMIYTGVRTKEYDAVSAVISGLLEVLSGSIERALENMKSRQDPK